MVTGLDKMKVVSDNPDCVERDISAAAKLYF